MVIKKSIIKKEKLINFNIILPKNWVKINEKDTEARFNKELKIEAPEGHKLHGKEIKALAYRKDQDDVIYYIKDENKFAIVHLTCSGRKDNHKEFPWTTIYNNIKKVEKNLNN